MKILLLEGSSMWCELITGWLKEVEDVTIYAEGEDLPRSVTGILIGFDPDLVIMNWKDFGVRILREIHSFSAGVEVWVLTGYDPRVIHPTAAEADLIISRNYVTREVLTALVEQAKRLLKKHTLVAFQPPRV